MALLAGWTALVTSGVVLGARLPSSATMDLIAPLALLALVRGPARRRRGPPRRDAAVAVALVGAELPAGVPVLLAMAAGAAAGAGRRTRHDRVARSAHRRAGSNGRLFPLLLADRWTPSPATVRGLRHAGIAALSAIAATSLRAPSLTGSPGAALRRWRRWASARPPPSAAGR